MTARDAHAWLPFVDSYVDGTLDESEALRLRLAADTSRELARAVRDARTFHRALSSMPVASPSSAFDQRVLDSVPLARYASAPRRAPIVVALGELTPDFVQRWAAILGRGSSALAVAWLLATVLGSTALRGPLSAAGAGLGDSLRNWAEGASSPALGPLAGAVSAAYDACFGALGTAAGAIGLGLTIFLLGAVVGGIGLWAALRSRSAARGRAGHHA